MAAKQLMILDGGLGRELLLINAPFKQPEWSALALYEAPELVAKAHQNFINAGADVITTNSYSLVPFHIGEERFQRDAGRLAILAANIARREADSADRRVLVAGSIPPALGSYRPDLFERHAAERIHKVLIQAQAQLVDFWLAETISSIAEATEINDSLAGTSLPKWFSFTLRDSDAAEDEVVALRSGESIEQAVKFAISSGTERLLFNCSHPEIMSKAVSAAGNMIKALDAPLELGVYANAFTDDQVRSRANSGLSDLRKDLEPIKYGDIAQVWLDMGASAIGGCCGITPDHISYLSSVLKARNSGVA